MICGAEHAGAGTIVRLAARGDDREHRVIDAIEGSRLADRDIEKILSNVEVRSFATRDEQEVSGYAGVTATIFASWSVLPLNENHVRQLHRDLLRYSTKDERHRGDYKKLDNDVECPHRKQRRRSSRPGRGPPARGTERS